MVFDRRFNAASPRYLGSASNAQQQKRRAPPGALGLLRPLDPVLLNGVRFHSIEGSVPSAKAPVAQLDRATDF